MPYKLLLLMAALTLTNCLDTANINASSDRSGSERLTHREVLLEMGYADEDIVEHDSGFIVEGDLLYTKASLEKFTTPPSEKALGKGTQIRARRGYWWDRYWYYYLLSDNREQDLTYCLVIDSKVVEKGWKSIVERETQKAIDSWNQAGSDANLRLLRSPTEECDTRIKVHYVDKYDGWAGITKRVDGTPSPRIDINIDPENYTVAEVYANVVAHEIGHSLGLGHADVHNDQYGHVPGTEYTDMSSVMVRTVTCIPGKGSLPCRTQPSTGDYQTLNILYPPSNGSRHTFFRNETSGYIEKIRIHGNGLDISRWYDGSSDYISLDWQKIATNWKPWSNYWTDPRDFIEGRFYPRNAENQSGTVGHGFVHVVRNSNYVNIWRIKSDGKYTVRQYRPGSGYPAVKGSQFLAGDFDGDGYTDLVHLLDRSYNLWLNNKNGTFNIRNHVPWAGYWVGVDNREYVVKDVNGDGKDDVVHAYPYENVWYGAAFLNLVNNGMIAEHNPNL